MEINFPQDYVIIDYNIYQNNSFRRKKQGIEQKYFVFFIFFYSLFIYLISNFVVFCN